MKRLAVWIGNGKIWLAFDEDLEVAFQDRDGEYIEIVPADPERLELEFAEVRKAIHENP